MKSQPKTNRIVKGFLGYLSETNQSLLLPDVAKELDSLAGTKEKADTGVVTSVTPLTAGQMATVESTVRKIFGRPIKIKQALDNGLLGGFTLKVGDWYVDATVAHDIAEIKQLVLT